MSRSKKKKHNLIKSVRRAEDLFNLEDDASRIFEDYVNSEDFSNIIKDFDVEDQGYSISRSSAKKFVIDLHGYNVRQARQKVDDEFAIFLNSKQRIDVRIITGKGRHSGSSGPVLMDDIYNYIWNKYARYILTMDENPSLARINNLPLRGHFDISVKSK